MKYRFFLKAYFLVILIVASFSCKDTESQETNDFPEITGAYFNETLPSTTVARFAPNVFTAELHAPPIFSPDGTEVFWNYMSREYMNIQYMKLIDGMWTQPASVPFGFPEGSDSPFITSDGTKMVFIKGHYSGSYGPQNICIVEKSNGEWSSPQVLNIDGDRIESHWQVSMTDNQNIYYSTGGNIYFSEYVNGEYKTAEKLGTMINTEEAMESSPFIAPDESYLIFDRAITYADLYISFKQDDGSWGEAVNMEELNGAYHELYANVSPDGRFIMFLKSTWDGLVPHWVDASIIKNYRNP